MIPLKFFRWMHLECLMLMNWHIKIYTVFYGMLITITLIWFAYKNYKKLFHKLNSDHLFSNSQDNLDLSRNNDFGTNETTPLITSKPQNINKIKSPKDSLTILCSTKPKFLSIDKVLSEAQGYKITHLDSILSYCFALSIIWSEFLIISLITIESKIPRSDSHITWDERATLFIFSWFLGFISFGIGRFLCSPQHPFFMTECPLYCCTHLLLPINNSNAIRKDHIFKRPYTILTVKYSHLSKYVEYSNIRFCYDEIEDKFCSYSCQLEQFILEARGSNYSGISEEESFKRKAFVGNNTISMGEKRFIEIFSSFEETSLIFQLFILWAQLYWRNYFSPLIWILISLYSVLSKIFIQITNNKRLKNETEKIEKTKFLINRNSSSTEISSKDLTLGDIVIFNGPSIIPCDILLLTGQAEIDESSLTGEAHPSYKYPVCFSEDLKSFKMELLSQKKILYGGTYLQSCTSNNEDSRFSNTCINNINNKIYGMVIAVGSNTRKGKFIESVNLSDNITFKYGKQLPQIFFLLGIYAICCIIVQTILLDFSASTFFYGLGTISQVTPIWISSVLYLSQNIASRRLLEEKQLYCIDSSRIPIAGKIRVFCFDKTGTITEQKMKLSGVMPFNDFEIYSSLEENMENTKEMKTNKPTKKEIVLGLLTCHSLTIDQSHQLIGNEVDLRMIQFVDGFLSYDETNSRRKASSKLFQDISPIILKQFEFDNFKRCMSVIISQPGLNYSLVFTKGSSDTIASICSPHDSQEIERRSKHYSQAGYYVIVLAFKEIEILSEESLESITRDQVESNLKILAFLLFENDLRRESEQVISKLKQAKIRPVIITGDSPETSYNIGFKSGFFDEMTKNFISSPPLFGKIKNDEVIWSHLDSNEEFKTYDVLLSKHSSELVIDSNCFHLLQNLKVKLQKNDQPEEYFLLDLLLNRIRIFARMKPEDKISIIKIFINNGYITGMIGDGANDTGALREAHSGISLSRGATSLFAPFTSETPSLYTVLDLIREGRSSLVTSFSCFKFMILFGLLMSFTKLTLFALVHSVIPEMGYIYMDCLILLSLSRAMAFSRPNENLKSRSPTSSLLGPTTIISLLSIFVVDILFLIILIGQMTSFGLRSNLDYNQAIPISAWWMKSDNYEAPGVWIWLCFQLINSAFIFSLGHTFRQNVFSNIHLLLCSSLLTIGLIFLVISPPSTITCLFRINCNDEISNSLNVPLIKWISITAKGMPFWGETGNNVLPFKWKVRFLLINLSNSIINIIIIKWLVLGAPASYFRKKSNEKGSGDVIQV